MYKRQLLGASTLVFLYNVWKSRNHPLVNTDDPWGWGRSLEWATSCPPPRHNFTSIPRIRSESPAFDLHHPEVALAEYGEVGVEGDFDNTTVDAAEDTGRVDELVDRVRGTSDDPAVGQDERRPSQSPEPGQGQQ